MCWATGRPGIGGRIRWKRAARAAAPSCRWTPCTCRWSISSAPPPPPKPISRKCAGAIRSAWTWTRRPGFFGHFLEGFEEQLESWRLLSENVPALRADGPARSGRRALAVTVPRGKRSVTVGTTRLRGWFALEHGATGVSLSLRTRAGMGRVRFTLLANAYGPGQAVSPSTVEAALRAEWQRIDLPFSSFPRLDLAEVDLFALEFLGEGPLEFLVDDLQLLGPWRYE